MEQSDTAHAESVAERPTAKVACSFCGKGQDKVRKIIAGPHVYICDECVELAGDIISGEWEEERKVRQESERAVASEPSGQTLFRHSAPCAICHLPQPIEALLPLGERGFLCAACLEVVRLAADAGSD